MQAIKTCLRKSFQFSGRASRSEYWWFLPVGIALPICALALTRVFAPDIAYLGICAVFLVALLPLMAVTRRRLLDSGEAASWFETPLMALVVVLIAGWGIAFLFEWFSSAIDAGADGPTGFGYFLIWLFGNAILIPVFVQQLLTGFVTGTALFGQMTAPSNSTSAKPGKPCQR